MKNNNMKEYQLEQEEFKALDYYLQASKLYDSGLWLCQEDWGEDYFHDDENEENLSLKEGLQIVYESIVPEYVEEYPIWVRRGLNKLFKRLLNIDLDLKEIELEKIVYNDLLVDDLEQLSYSIFQDETCVESEKVANDCLHYLVDNLREVYNLIDTLDELGVFEVATDEIQEIRNKIDLYQVGDIINFIETIRIKKIEEE